MAGEKLRTLITAIWGGFHARSSRRLERVFFVVLQEAKEISRCRDVFLSSCGRLDVVRDWMREIGYWIWREERESHKRIREIGCGRLPPIARIAAYWFSPPLD